MNDKFTEQRIIVNFLVKLNKSGTDIFDKFKLVYGVDAVSRAHVFEWAKRLRKGEWMRMMTRVWDVHCLPKWTKMSIGGECWSDLTYF